MYEVSKGALEYKSIQEFKGNICSLQPLAQTTLSSV